MCTNISFSASHLLHERVFALFILCSIYCRLICLVRSLPAFCNVSCPVYLWTEHTYWLIPPDVVSWSHTFHRLHSVDFVFPIQFLILDLNVLQDSGKKAFGPVSLVFAHLFALLFSVLFYWILPCSGAHMMVTCFSSSSAVSAVLYNPLQAVILFHSLLGLELPFDYYWTL